MTPARCYRRCTVCGLRWNVSRLVPGPERYVCPRCAGKRKAPSGTAIPTESKVK